MFFKKKELSSEEIVEETPKVDLVDEKKEKNDSDNIFSELSWWLDFLNEQQDTFVKEEVKKDVHYYLLKVTKGTIIFNTLLVIFLFLLFIFVKIQNNTNFYSKPFLDPICFLLISDDMRNTWDYCSWVASLSQDYKSKTESLKSEIVKRISLLSEDIYSIENFVYSKEVVFLLDAKVNKLNSVDILNDFDRMKNDFSSWDKKMLVCDKVIVTKESIDVNCDAYSSSWESSTSWWWIVWDTWDRNSSLIEWTSISVASSFLNFIEKNPSYNFKVLEKQKTFTSDIVIWEWPYVRKTSFNFKLKYNDLVNNLSL